MKIRKYQFKDYKNVLELFYNTVHYINARDYNEEQLNAWAPENYNSLSWEKRLSDNYSVVAEIGDKLVGFGTVDDAGYFDFLYVHKDYQRLGVATLIADEIEEYVYSRGIKSVSTHASITALAFFKQRGYSVLKKQNIERNGVYFINFMMLKSL